MPKQKTKKALTKRFRITKNGKVMRGHAFAGHLNAKKSSKRLRRLHKQVVTKKSYADRIKKALGIGK